MCHCVAAQRFLSAFSCVWKITNTHRDTAGGAHCWVLAGISGRLHHSGSTATWMLVAVEQNVKQHNEAEQDTMSSCTEPEQLMWRRRQMVVSKQMIDWTRLASSFPRVVQLRMENKWSTCIVDDVLRNCSGTVRAFPGDTSCSVFVILSTLFLRAYPLHSALVLLELCSLVCYESKTDTFIELFTSKCCRWCLLCRDIWYVNNTARHAE